MSASIRLVTFECDEPTGTRAVLDIVEIATATTPTPLTWTELSRDKGRRALLLALVAQIDQVAAGHLDEISISIGSMDD